jgi:hypothetical protein
MSNNHPMHKPVLKILLGSVLAFLSLKSYPQHQNILISSQNMPNESSIAMDVNQPNLMVAGTNLNNIHRSTDGGLTWASDILSDTLNGVWGDPVIVCDKFGHFYYFHLSNPPSGSWVDRIVCQKSINQGISFATGTSVGKNGTKVQDKHWVAIDRANNHIYVTWTEFDEYGSSNPADSTRILFSKSTDGGATWQVPKRINKISGDCLDSDNTVEGAVPAIGPNGEIYVSWAGPAGLVFNKSIDGGQSWMNNDVLIANLGLGWDYKIPGIYRANGLPVTLCDTAAASPYRGTIYVNWSAQMGDSTDTDVFLAKSTDGGITWSNPIRVNDDGPGKHQFFTWMAIDQKFGYLYFVFYDRRNYSDNQTDVYMARSTDGGQSFENFKISQSPFLPDENVFFGDYTNITAYNNIVRPIWTRLDNNDLSLWTAIINTQLLGSQLAENITDHDYSVYPNPNRDSINFSFKMHGTDLVTISITDMNGKLISTPIKNKTYNYGKYIETFSKAELRLSKGEYFYTIKVGNKTSKGKLISIN